MKRWPMVILVLLVVLGAVVPGCRHVVRYDRRLVAADSLMRTNPDSALSLLESLNYSPARGEVARSDGGGGTALATDGDRAYRDLLLTQARYKAYITATSDSDINRALAYFSAHPADREKLTRAYIYKGAVMDELGYPDSAMFYYKTAEATAAPYDYFNLGYVNIRMGALYRDHYSMDGSDIKKYEKALDYLSNFPYSNQRITCMINLGSLYCLKEPMKADSLLNKASSLALLIKDTVYYVGAIQNLIKNELCKNNIEHANRLVHNVLKLKNPPLTVPFCIYAAQTYACLNMKDSAELFLGMVNEGDLIDEVDKIAYKQSLGEIALINGDISGHLRLKDICRKHSDSLLSVNQSLIILDIEEQFDNQMKSAVMQSQKNSSVWICTLICTILMILGMASALLIINRNKHRLHMKRLHLMLKNSDSQLVEMKNSLDRLSKLEVRDYRLKGFLDSYMDLMRDFMEECYHEPNKKLSQRMKRIIKFQNSNKDKWEKLYDFIDMEHNGIIARTRVDYPQLNDKDILLIALSAMGFSCIQIAMILGYSNHTSIGTIRKRLAEKMKLGCTFTEYVSRFM